MQIVCNSDGFGLTAPIVMSFVTYVFLMKNILDSFN